MADKKQNNTKIQRCEMKTNEQLVELILNYKKKAEVGIDYFEN